MKEAPTVFTFVPEKNVYDFQKPVFGDSSFEDVEMQIVCTERHIRIRFLDSAIQFNTFLYEKLIS